MLGLEIGFGSGFGFGLGLLFRFLYWRGGGKCPRGSCCMGEGGNLC